MIILIISVFKISFTEQAHIPNIYILVYTEKNSHRAWIHCTNVSIWHPRPCHNINPIYLFRYISFYSSPTKLHINIWVIILRKWSTLHPLCPSSGCYICLEYLLSLPYPYLTPHFNSLKYLAIKNVNKIFKFTSNIQSITYILWNICTPPAASPLVPIWVIR